jgi:hypothetical protein
VVVVVVGEGVRSGLARKISQVIPGASAYMRQGYDNYRRRMLPGFARGKNQPGRVGQAHLIPDA